MAREARTEGPWQDFFHLVELQRVPLLLSAFAAFILALPDQSIDSYISIAQNLRLTKPWAHLTDERAITGVVLLAGLSSVAVLGGALLGSLSCGGWFRAPRSRPVGFQFLAMGAARRRIAAGSGACIRDLSGGAAGA